MSDQTPPSGPDPYQQNPYGHPPYGRSPSDPAGQNQEDPYGATPSPYGRPQQNPYGAAPAPYGQPQQSPYGQQPELSPYGQPASGQPYGAAPYSQRDPGRRPGTVTTAAVLTIVLSSIVLLFSIAGVIGLLAARDNVLDGVRNDSQFDRISADSLYTVILLVFVVLLIWSASAIALGVLTMRRSRAARIALVVSSVITAIVSLIAIAALLSAIWLIASIAVVVLLFTGGAPDWFARRDADPLPTGTSQPWG